MIDFIEGRIAAKEPGKLVVQTGGLGFALKVSHQTLSSLPPQGDMVTVYTNMQVREDDISLYGFSDKDERAFFELLIQVSGVGPKLALAILSAFPVATIKKALVLGDLATLGSIPGIGKKTAQRMVLELKDKMDKELLFGEADGAFAPAGDGGVREEVAQAIEALEVLGYSRSEIMKAFAGKELGELDVEGIIKLGLGLLARF